MRRDALVAAVAALVLSPATASAATQPSYSATVKSTGGVLVRWHGAPDRCGAAGVCGLTGSVGLFPNEDYSVRKSRNSTSTRDRSIQSGGTVRVERGGDGAPRGICIDGTGGPFSFGDSDGGGAFIGGIETEEFSLKLTPVGSDGPAPGAGRCAGPLPADLIDRFPSRSVDLRRLAGKTTRVDLSGTTPFSAGAFDGEIVSSVRYTIVGGRKSRVRVPTASEPSAAARRRARRLARLYKSVRTEQLIVGYDIAGVDGQLTTTFAGSGAAARCEPVDACGLEGELTLTPAVAEGANLTFFGSRRAPAGRRTTRGRALDALRRGRFTISNSFGSFGSGRGSLSATARRLGEPACTDTVEVDMPSLELTRSLKARLQSGVSMRTHCPGPATSDVISGRVLASGTVSKGRLGDDELTLSLAASGSFAGSGYTGTRGGALEVRLTRKRVDVSRTVEMVRR